MRLKQKIALSMLIFTLISKIEAPERDWLWFCGISFSNCIEFITKPMVPGICSTLFGDSEASLQLPSVPDEKNDETNLDPGCIDIRVPAEEETRLVSLPMPSETKKTTEVKIKTALDNLHKAMGDLAGFIFHASYKDHNPKLLSDGYRNLLSMAFKSSKEIDKLIQKRNGQLDLEFIEENKDVVVKILKELKEFEELEKNTKELESKVGQSSNGLNPQTNDAAREAEETMSLQDSRCEPVSLPIEVKIDKALHTIESQIIERLPDATTARDNLFKAIEDLSELVSKILSSSKKALTENKYQFDTLLSEICRSLEGTSSRIAEKIIITGQHLTEGIQKFFEHMSRKLKALESLSQISKEVKVSSSDESLEVTSPIAIVAQEEQPVVSPSVANPKTPEPKAKVISLWTYAGFKGEVTTPQVWPAKSSDSDEEDSVLAKPNKAFLGMCSALSKTESLEAKSETGELSSEAGIPSTEALTGRPSSASSSSTDSVEEVKPLVLNETAEVASPKTESKPATNVWKKDENGKWALAKSEPTHKASVKSEIDTTQPMTVKERLEQIAASNNERGIYFYIDPNPTGRASDWKTDSTREIKGEKRPSWKKLENTPERATVEITTQEQCPLVENAFTVFLKPSPKENTPTSKIDAIIEECGFVGNNITSKTALLLEEFRKSGKQDSLNGTVRVVNPGNGKPVQKRVSETPDWRKALAAKAAAAKAGA